MKSLLRFVLLLALFTVPAMAVDAPPGEMFPAPVTTPDSTASPTAPTTPAPAPEAPKEETKEKPKQTRARKPKAEDAPPAPQPPDTDPELGDMTPAFIRYRLEHFPDEAVPYYQARRHRLSEELQAALDEAAE